MGATVREKSYICCPWYALAAWRFCVLRCKMVAITRRVLVHKADLAETLAMAETHRVSMFCVCSYALGLAMWLACVRV